MATNTQVAGGHAPGFGVTQRRDAWWVGPGVTFAVFSFFLVYVHWRMFEANWFFADPYLSPLYAPLFFVPPHLVGTEVGTKLMEHAWFGAWPTTGIFALWPAWLPKSPAFFILIFPAGFRFTCYYYRKAYYRAFAGSPPGCAVGPLAQRKKYKGETALLLFQNLHRFFLYFALIFIGLLYYDAALGLKKNGQWGIGLGTVVMFVNATLIAGYTFGCHSLRHLIGGRKDAMSCGKSTLTFMCWKKASWFNSKHMAWAWVSLIWVMLTDLYIRMVSVGAFPDPNTW